MVRKKKAAVPSESTALLHSVLNPIADGMISMNEQGIIGNGREVTAVRKEGTESPIDPGR